jgi:long-chain fatty acid transport protein
MTPSRFVVVLLAATTILSASAFASGFQLNEHGARAMAQAGAFAARATDGSAMYFNPAGLGFQTQGSVLVGVTLIAPTSSFYGPLENNSNTKYEQTKQVFTPVNGYVVYPVIDRLTVGLAVNNQYGLGTEWPSDWPGRYLAVKTDLSSWFFTPTVSYRLTDGLSVGAGFVYATGSVKLNRSVAQPFASPVTTALDLSGHGMSFSAGALLKITPDLSVGASYRGQVKIDASGSAAFTPNYAALQLPQGDVSASITLPATGFFGVAYRPMKNLEVEADYQYVGWSSYKDLTFHFSANNSTSSSPKNYSDTYIIRIGGEYTMDAWQFRAGYLYDHSPVSSEYVEPILPDANRNGINIGVGYDITPNWNVSAAYFFLKFDERVVNNSIPENGFNGTYHSYANLFGVNLEFKF